jgi:hypothetical protein
MKIACIAWGSLIWNPQSIKIRGSWFNDGPFLPIEFARQSRDGRITLVIEVNSPPIQTLWGLMSTNNFNDAIESLKTREGTTKSQIHNQNLDSKPQTKVHEIIKQWLIGKNLDCAIWTGLPPRFDGENNVVPTIEQLFDYFDKMDCALFKVSAEYVINTPKQVDTPYRRLFEKKYNWEKD